MEKSSEKWRTSMYFVFKAGGTLDNVASINYIEGSYYMKEDTELLMETLEQ